MWFHYCNEKTHVKTLKRKISCDAMESKSGGLTTDQKVKVYYSLPEFITTKIVT